MALKAFVDNFSIQVVESLLIGDMWSTSPPSDVGQMSSKLISQIAAESTESQALRQQLDRKLHILERGLEICQRQSTHNLIGTIHNSLSPFGTFGALSVYIWHLLGHASLPAPRGEAREELQSNEKDSQRKATPNHSSSSESSLPAMVSPVTGAPLGWDN